jgi:TPR repeat protein
MKEAFADILATGKPNSLGRTDEVIEAVLQDKSRLDELYACLFHDDAWLRMRAADALEKVCRQHPEWLLPHIDKFQEELARSNQPSIQWHLAQIYSQVDVSPEQKQKAIQWLENLISTVEVDWIVAANAMDTLVQFAKDGSVTEKQVISLLRVQQGHKSKAVVRRADKLLNQMLEK